MLELFFDAHSLVHYEFIAEGSTVNKEMYIKTIHHLRHAVRGKQVDSSTPSSPPVHQSLVVKKYLPRHNITALEYLLRSPDLSPPDIFMFP
jgi:hypothetical protein